jgi:hypothetical protein
VLADAAAGYVLAARLNRDTSVPAYAANAVASDALEFPIYEHRAIPGEGSDMASARLPLRMQMASAIPRSYDELWLV